MATLTATPPGTRGRLTNREIALAAAALGLASVWIGAFDEDGVRNALGLEKPLRPIAILPIGHAGEEPEIAPRRSLMSLVHYINTSS